jgi:hypothetical protein
LSERAAELGSQATSPSYELGSPSSGSSSGRRASSTDRLRAHRKILPDTCPADISASGRPTPDATARLAEGAGQRQISKMALAASPPRFCSAAFAAALRRSSRIRSRIRGS